MVQFQKNRDIRRAREETSEDRRLNSDDNVCRRVVGEAERPGLQLHSELQRVHTVESNSEFIFTFVLKQNFKQ